MLKQTIVLIVILTGVSLGALGAGDIGQKAEGRTEIKHPQNPVRPFPYKEEEVTFENRGAGVALAGTFTRPENGAPFPAVILVHGSGSIDRDGAMLGHRPFLVLADFLTRSGFAVLRYDKRGVGKSQGARGATTAELATDALAAFGYLKTRNDVNAKKIGMIGHSEGGAIAPMCAVQAGDLAFIVLLAGPGRQGKDIILGQLESFARADGASEDEVQKTLRFNKPILDVIAGPEDDGRAYDDILAIVEKDIAGKSEEERKDPAYQKGAVDAMIKNMLRPAYRFFVKYDSRTSLEKVRIPVLALTGEKDLWVNAKLNLPEIEKSLRKAGNTNFKTVEMPGLNHLLQHAKKGTLEEIQGIEETMSPEVLNLIKDWLAPFLR